MNETPSSGRVHIAFFGRRNVGKSRLVNAVTGQDIALVSDVKGTTTDPVHKAMELLPLGPVVIIDTPGIDDEGTLGEMRVRRAKRVLNKTDVAVLVAEASAPLGQAETELVGIFREKNIPFIVALNKSDLSPLLTEEDGPTSALSLPETLLVSAKTGFNVNVLKDRIAGLVRSDGTGKRLVADLIRPLDIVLLVVPIDKAAPKGRLILPQQQTIRDVLEAGAIAVVVRDTELKGALARLRGADGKGEGKPALVITDSQAFAQVSKIVPKDIPLTSFSILFARYKGSLESSLDGVAMLDKLQDGDKVLICEGGTHHRQCDDIGTVKLPGMIKAFTGKEPEFSFCSGGDFPDDLSGYGYRMVIHCGGCMLNDREMQYRRLSAEDQNVPFTNYGITIARTKGILARSVAVFS